MCPIQRLNRTEFAASVKALIGVDIDPKQTLPTEIEVEGFSNIAGALAVSPSFMEQYLSAARRAARLAVGEPVPKMAKVTIPATPGQPRPPFPLGTRGGTQPRRHPLHARVPGRRRISLQCSGRRLHRHGSLSARRADRGHAGHPDRRRGSGAQGNRRAASTWISPTATVPQARKAILAKVASAAQVKAGRREVVMTYIERSQVLEQRCHRRRLGGLRRRRPGLRRAHHPDRDRDRRTVLAPRPVDERQPRQDLRLPTEERRGRAALRGKDRATPGDAGVPPSGDRCRRADADEILRTGPGGSRRLRLRRDRTGHRSPVESRLPVSRHLDVAAGPTSRAC